MKSQRDTLGKIQVVTNILAAIAIPLLIAIFGWKVQSEISNQSVNKDYVKMALDILNDKQQNNDRELRRWAIDILDKNSPIPFSEKMREKIEVGDLLIARFAIPKPPKSLMSDPKKLVPLPDDAKGTSHELLLNVVKNYNICHQNALQLEYLQNWANIVIDSHNKPGPHTKIIGLEKTMPNKKINKDNLLSGQNPPTE